jgi:thiopurine S-methyltransferase
MQAEYWRRKWLDDQIGFHQQKVNSRLQKYWPELDVPDKSTVFVPLCGKSLDMLWLHLQGHPVLGIELSEKAIQAFFAENDLPCQHHRTGDFEVYSGIEHAQGITLMAGDFFSLTPAQVAHCQGFYDRAALIAMDPEMRVKYASQMGKIVPVGARGLLLTIAYDQQRLQGPPFSVPDDNVRKLLGTDFHIAELAHYSGPEYRGNLSSRGIETLDERVYFLTRNP